MNLSGLAKDRSPQSPIRHYRSLGTVYRFLLRSRRGWLSVSIVPFIISAALLVPGRQPEKPSAVPDSLPPAEFARLVQDISEDGGYFHSDNLISNETTYLHVVHKLQQLGATGGAYIGVGPEQNFTYIAKVRPRIAFIIDIRRQAMVQQLMYKAIFQLAPTRADFLSLLLSKPLPKTGLPPRNASAADLIALFRNIQVDDKQYLANLAEIRKLIKDGFRITLTEADNSGLEYIYKSFKTDGLDITYQMGGYRSAYFPTLGDLITGTDLQGKPGNFLADADDYDFVRGMHRKNLIIPIVGDFAGKKALAAVGDYLRKTGLTVTAFYTSNVEQYLFQNGVFAGFAANVGKLPVTDHSLFIRSVPARVAYSHPALRSGHMSIALLQQMNVFLQDYAGGQYQTYHDLVTTHYIAAD
ncbi:MAG TPA: hypothetical protein VKJ45_08080 [Blastocatellia bacterium]|nr:hypothetical protein [Blastocatellia bacterium]